MNEHFWQDETGNTISGWMPPPYGDIKEYPAEGQNYFQAITTMPSELRLDPEYHTLCQFTRSNIIKEYDGKKFIDPNGKIRVAIFYSCKITRRVGYDANANKIDILKVISYFNAPLLSEYESGKYSSNAPNNYPTPQDPAWIDWRIPAK